MTRPRVAVVQGGPASEAEVSRTSARAVARALAATGHDVVSLELTPAVAGELHAARPDVVFPVVHGAVGEDGSLQGLLEVLELPYVGSGVLASAIAMDKATARRLFAADGLPVARGFAARRGQDGDAASVAERARRELGARLVVKPAQSGSAIGVTRLGEDADLDEVARAVQAAWALDATAIVEHFARGREVTCGVLDVDVDVGGESGARALPPTEIETPRDGFYSYEARYAQGRSVHTCPARLPADVAARVQDVALRAHRALGCRDLSRADFIVGDDDDDKASVTLLEVNTMPGFTGTSLFPEAAAVVGVDFASLCASLVAAAVRRGTTVRNAALRFPT